MTIGTSAPTDSGDAIADLADFYDNLTPEQEAELDAQSETVTLRRRPGARSLVWEPEHGGYVPPLLVADEAHLPRFDVLLDDTGWVIYEALRGPEDKRAS